MSGLALIAVIAFVAIGLVVWIVDAANSAAERAKQERLRAKQQREQKKLEDKRRTEEAIRIVRESAPELAALRKTVNVLRYFVADANAYRPRFITRFLNSLVSFFPRNYEGAGVGPDPEPWVTTVGNLLVPKAHELRLIYTKCLSFEPPPPPEYPRVESPPPDNKTVTDDGDRKFLTRLRKLFTFEPSQSLKLQEATSQLQNQFAEQKRKAEEARDLMDIHIANERLAYDEQLALIHPH